MNLAKPAVLHLLLWTLLLLGLFGAMSVSYEHLSGQEACPKLSIVPVCLVVCLGYLLMVTSQIRFNTAIRIGLFYAGWYPVFIIATVGAAMELYYSDICPKGTGGLPLCYVSFALCMLVLMLSLAARRNTFRQ